LRLNTSYVAISYLKTLDMSVKRVLFIFLCLAIHLAVALNPLPVLAQKVVINETHVDSLLQIQVAQGTDSLFKIIGRLPIWLIDQNIALEIASNLEIPTDPYGTERRYLFDIAKHVESEKILKKLNTVIDSDLNSIRDSLSNHGSVLQIRKDLLIAYYYQNPDQVLQALSSRVDKLKDLLEMGRIIAKDERRDIITRFAQGSSIQDRNVNNLTYNMHALVSILNRINPDLYTDDQIEELENSIPRRHKLGFIDFDLPHRSAELRIFHDARVSKQSNHYLFNDNANALDPRLDHLVMNVNVVYQSEHKKLVQEYSTFADTKENLYYSSYLTTYLIYTVEDELIELMIDDITYN